MPKLDGKLSKLINGSKSDFSIDFSAVLTDTINTKWYYSSVSIISVLFLLFNFCVSLSKHSYLISLLFLFYF